MAFDPDAYLSKSEPSAPAPTKGFDPDAYLSKAEQTSSATPPVEGKGGAAFGMYPKPKMGPGTDATGLGAFAASAIEGAAATPGVLLGARAGAAIMPPVAPIIGPLSKPAGAVVGGLVGGFASSGVISATESFIDKVMGTNISATRQAQQQQYPYQSLAGQVAGGGLNPWMKFGKPDSLTQGLAGAGIMTVIGAGQRMMQGGDPFDPAAITADVVLGGLTKPTARGQRLLGQTPVASTKTKPFDAPDRPPETATPEEKAEYIKKLEAIKAERDSKAPLVEAAIRNKETGEIERMGPKHDQERKDATKDTHEEGFVDELGNFHERTAAVDQAKRAGQIPEDHVLESPPGETPGLHSGDLRKAGDERFKLTEEQPTSKSKSKPPVEEGPKTREEHKKAIDNLEYDLFVTHEIDLQEAKRMGDTAGVAEIESRIKRDQEKLDQLSKDIPPVQFANPLKPTWEELHDHLWNALNMGEAFDKVLSANIGSKGQKFLIKALNQSEFIRSARLELSKELIKYTDKDGFEKQDANGMYTGDNVHKVDLGKKGDLQTLLHEAIHAGTQRLLNQSNHPAAIKLQEMFKEFEGRYNVGYDIAFENYLKENPNATVGERKNFEKDYRKQNKDYGLTDVHEFAAEAFNNRKFQKLLRSIKSKEPQTVIGNMWESFKNTVREGLGIPESERTAFDDAIEHGVKLIEESKGYTPFDLAARTSPSVAKAAEKVDPRSIPNEEEFYKHATDIYERYGEDEAIKFFEDYNKNLKERTIPVPNNNEELDDATHKLKTFTVKDISEKRVWMDEARKAGVTEEDSAKWFMMIENGEELPTEALKWLGEGQKEAKALYDRAVAMKKLGFEINIGTEFFTGQSRIRLWSEKERPGWKETLKKFFSNDGPMGDKVGDEVDAAIERKVYQLDDGRVVEIHRQPKDVATPKGTIKKGTEIWEWKDGVKKQIGHTPDLNFKRGDKVTIGGKEVTMVDGKVPDIEKHSTYKYSHDALASQAMAVIGLRKLIREAEFIHNLKKSEMFERVGFSPDKPLEDLPKGWKPPDNIDKIPQLRGWHFDPKTAAIIEDFAKVWNDGLWSKLSNAIVKNMMLNPVPHMFNEVMHLFVARGFTGWVDPRGVSSFVKSANRAVKDVGNQTKFFREVLTEGGTPLSADARNKGYFDNIFKEESKKIFGDPVMQKSLAGLAKKLGTSVGNLYNGISNASQKAMWFTRDVMYFQYLHETMDRYEKSTGNKMDLKDAIDHIERHMPNYRMPSEVLGSRSVAKLLKNPNVSLFARYHYGMVKSLVNTLKDVDPRNLSSPEGRQHFRDGVDSMLAIAIAMGFLYPLADKLAEAIFGEGAEQRRAGPFHLIQAAMDVSEGKKDASALIWPVFTFNPMLLMLVELGSAHKLTTGKAIYHIQDPIEDIASDIGQYAVKQVPQASPVLSAVADEGGDTQFVAKQLDIKAKTSEQLEIEDRAKKREERATKGRKTKREKGTYKP